MDYQARLKKIDAHLEAHPTDYQSVIARLKLRSDAIEHEMYRRKIFRLKRLNEVRRQLREIENGKESK